MQQKDIEAVLRRYRQGEATDEDLAFLEKWYVWHNRSNQDPEARQYDVSELLEDMGEVWSRLERRPSLIRRMLPYAAAVVLLMTSLGIWWQWSVETDPDLDMEEIIASSDIGPTITLGDGRVISLDETRTGIQMGSSVRYEDGTPVGELSRIKEPQELYIQVPTGTMYQLLLSDSTRVWLNAGSSLRYPSAFTGGQRTVELSGEAYFEVHPQYVEDRSGRHRQGFTVKTDRQLVQVLGTHFNVKAYPNGQQRTSLLEGKVQLATSEHSPFTILQPGQEATVEANGVTVREVDAESATAWTSGLFNFDHKTFDEIMQEVGIWYNLEIVYDGPVPTDTFFGQAYRSDNLATVLRLLESAQIQYRVTVDRKLIIKNKQG